ncbi:transcriptional regulator, TetR family [Ruminococcaceae bacterium YRB3002]|nr:transcriptional regulator, TetR family [Ruminococcaceae bacterium YRB3002]
MASDTKTLIKDTFIKLLEERPLSQITIKDIVNACGINRNSFYYHYEDLPSLIESIVMEEADRFTSQYASIDSFDSCMNVALEYALERRTLALHLYNSNNRDIFEMYFLKITDHVVRMYMDKLSEDIVISPRDKEIIVTYYKCLLFGMIVDWMATGMNTDVRSDFGRMTEIFTGMPEEIVRRVSDNP